MPCAMEKPVVFIQRGKLETLDDLRAILTFANKLGRNAGRIHKDIDMHYLNLF